MIGEAHEGHNWGSNWKATAAANKRALELRAEGYTVYRSQKEAPNGNKTYFVFAFSDQEDHDMVPPRNPDTHPKGRRLNVRTIHVGMDVAVETLPDEIDRRHGWRGVVVGVTLSREGAATARVQFAGADSQRVGIEVHRLRQVAQ